jgi:hypothetical protein
VQQKRTLAASQTAIVLCDVWDLHWCLGANERLLSMLGRMNETIQQARERGVHIIHAPSDTTDFYSASPARKRILEYPAIQPPPEIPHDDPPLPVDASDGGCDTNHNPGSVNERFWSRQHPAILIDEERDAISDNGREIYGYMQHRGIKSIIIMGVHTNMCILNRSFGIKQMVRWAVDIMLCRDLTDSMYNPSMAPYVSHDEGTRLVIAYIEKFWCPTVGSGDLTRFA